MITADKEAKKILFISVQENLSVIGLKSIHYFLLKNGYRSHLLYLPRFNPENLHALKRIGEFVARVNPRFIGVSLMSPEFNNARVISEYLKKRFPAVPIIWGGTHPTITPESCFPFADYVCIGEGERTALDLANAFAGGQDIKKIRNLCYKEGGTIRKNPLYPLIDNLDELPYFEHVPVSGFLQKPGGEIRRIDERVFRKESKWQGKMYELMTSRGCVFSCSFCCNNLFSKLYANNRKVRKRSVKSIISELESTLKNNPGIAIVHFQDDTFLSRSEEYLAEFSAAYKNKIRKPFIIHTIPIYINRNKLRLLKNAGLAWINMGLQSGSDRVCRDIYKRKSLKKHFLKGSELIKEFKIASKHDVILDNPFESEKDTLDTVEALIEARKPFLVDFYSLTFYPGTELYEKASAECPERIEDCRIKSYRQYSCNTINTLARFAVCLPETPMRAILRIYKANPRNFLFKIIFFISGFLYKIYYQPATFLKILKMAHENSYVKAAQNFSMYYKEWTNRKW